MNMDHRIQAAVELRLARGEAILLAAENQSQSVNIARRERGEGENSSILTGLAGPSSLAHSFERLAVLRFALRVTRPRVAIFNSMTL